MRHAAIAGAGLAGRLVAWRLARAGWRVSLFDAVARDDTRSASFTAAAMLSPLAELASCDVAVFEMAQRAMALWPTWLAELQADSGSAVFYRRDGALVVAHAADGSSLAHFELLLRRKLPEAHRTQLQTLDGDGVAAREPLLAGRFERGLFLAGEGQLDNGELLHALARALDALGVQWHERDAVHALRGGELHSEHRMCHADVLIDTRGLGARGDASQASTVRAEVSKPRAGLSKPSIPQAERGFAFGPMSLDARVRRVADGSTLRGVRGEILTIECAGISLQRPVRLMHPRYQLYVVPRPNHRFVVGATELESEDEGPITMRSLLELGSALHSLHPAFGEARVLHAAAALRPALDDNIPALREHAGVWQLNGLYRHGYLCAPALVDSLTRSLGA